MKIALIGNQNCGKTSIFNLLTGMNQKIGNWPGVTLERKSGIIKGTRHELIDLPGIYSLESYTTEEIISRNFLLETKVDLIINVVDATSIERGLYLTSQLLDLDMKVILVLNMVDMLKIKGILIDKAKLESILGIKVFMVSALKNEGFDELIQALCCISFSKLNKIMMFPREIENIILSIENRSIEKLNKRYRAIELLQKGDLSYRKNLENKYNMDIYEILITFRYEYISDICNRCIRKGSVRKNITYTLDRIFMNKFSAFPIFVAIMFLIYYLSVGIVGDFTSEIINNSISNIKYFFEEFLLAIGVSKWLISMICNGIISGVGSVLGFLPQLVTLFFCTSVLQSTGYMSRIAFLLDKFFRKIGLSGKSLIPFIIGTGCSVPGIMSSRIIENEHERKVVACVTSFIPCSAKLPIITLFTSYFFDKYKSLIAISFYILSILLIILSLLIINKFSKNKTISSYISELPEYRLPSIKYIIRDVFDKIKEFVKKAGTIIFLSSIIVWFLLSFSTSFKYGVEISDSILAFIGKKISWFFYPIVGCNNWEISVSAIQGLIAKEQVVSSMEIISGLSVELRNGLEIFSVGGPFSFFNRASSYAYVAFNLFSAPCIGAIASLKKELGSFKLMFFAIFFQTTLAWVVAAILFKALGCFW